MSQFNPIAINNPNLPEENDPNESFESDESESEELKIMEASGILKPNYSEGTDLNQKDGDIYNEQSLCIEDDISDELEILTNLGIINRNFGKNYSKGTDINQIDGDIHNEKYLKDFERVDPYETTTYSRRESLYNDDDEISNELEILSTFGIIDGNLGKNETLHDGKSIYKEDIEIKDCTEQLASLGLPISYGRENKTEITSKQTKNKSQHQIKSNQKKNYKLIPLNKSHEIFKEIELIFKKCFIERKIAAIQRIENAKLKNRFENEKQQLIGLHGNDFELNIKELYHTSNAARNLICSRGLDLRVGRIGHFGRGIYFSDNVQKCMDYLKNEKGSAIYKCSVILGDIKVYESGEHDITLRQEPEKENGDFYHSVKGNMDGRNEFIIYDNRRCLINYRIVMEGTEDEDVEEIEDEIAIAEKREEENEKWIHKMHEMVDTCKHDEILDDAREKEIRNIEKIRLEIRRRRELQTGQPLTEVTYELLRAERRKWKKFQDKQIEEQKQSFAGASKDPVPLDENSAVQQTLDNLVMEFMAITNCEDLTIAKNLIEISNWNLNVAIDEYFYNTNY